MVQTFAAATMALRFDMSKRYEVQNLPEFLRPKLFGVFCFFLIVLIFFLFEVLFCIGFGFVFVVLFYGEGGGGRYFCGKSLLTKSFA